MKTHVDFSDASEDSVDIYDYALFHNPTWRSLLTPATKLTRSLELLLSRKKQPLMRQATHQRLCI
jgi:uncharacterized alpha-E superfamily protein